MSKSRKKISIFILGGTVLTEEDPLNNVVITEKDIKSWLAKMPEVNLMAEIETIFVLGERDIDPNLEIWTKTAKMVASRMKSTDGFVITHHAASALHAAVSFAFMLQNVTKPVVFTGSQIPLPSPDSDYAEQFQRYKGLGIKSNLINALHVALHGSSEVTIMFGNRLVRAVQARQEKSLTLNLFDAPLESVLGTIDFGIKVPDYINLKPSVKSFKFYQKLDDKVFALPSYPGFNENLLEFVRQKNPSGIVIQGSGAEMSLPEFKKILRPPYSLPVVLHSSIPYMGKRYDNLFVVDNMTFVTTLVKFMWILGQTKSNAKIAKMLKAETIFELIPEEKK